MQPKRSLPCSQFGYGLVNIYQGFCSSLKIVHGIARWNICDTNSEEIKSCRRICSESLCSYEDSQRQEDPEFRLSWWQKLSQQYFELVTFATPKMMVTSEINGVLELHITDTCSVRWQQSVILCSKYIPHNQNLREACAIWHSLCLKFNLWVFCKTVGHHFSFQFCLYIFYTSPNLWTHVLTACYWKTISVATTYDLLK